VILYKSSLDFGALAGRSREGARTGLDEAANLILDASREAVPKESGDLASSGEIQPSGDLERRIVFTSVYARWIHEHLRFKHPHGGGPKFLEVPLRANADRAREIVADAIRAAI